jgi:hypothetical protein
VGAAAKPAHVGVDHRQHGLIPLIRHAHLPHLGSVTDQPTQQEPITRQFSG